MAIFLGIFILPNVLKTFTKDKEVLGVRATGVSAPYTLELFAIEVLRSIAQKKGINSSNTITFEHVLALVAFAMGEGGDIDNKYLFNPFNSGLNAPDLNSGKFNASGLQGFNSFDAGVEATSRHMTNPNQSRLGNILSQKNSTAQDFMYALTYYTKYSGNSLWAGGSKTNPDGYYKERLNILASHRKAYRNSATTVLGTAAFEKPKGIRAPEKLVYDPKTGKPLSGKESIVAVKTSTSKTPTPSFTINTGKVIYAKWIEAADGKAKIKFKSDTTQDWYQLSCNDSKGKLIAGTSIKILNTYNSKDGYRYSNSKYTYTNRTCFISGVKWNNVKNVWGKAITIAQPDKAKTTTTSTPTSSANTSKITYAKWINPSTTSKYLALIMFKSSSTQDGYEITCKDPKSNVIIQDVYVHNKKNTDGYWYSNDRFTYVNRTCTIRGYKTISGKKTYGASLTIQKPDKPLMTSFTKNNGGLKSAVWVEKSSGRGRIKFQANQTQDWYNLVCYTPDGKKELLNVKMKNTLKSDGYRYSDSKYEIMNRCQLKGVLWNGSKNVWGPSTLIK